MTDGLKPKYREVIIAKLSAHPRVERIVLFGSRAMGIIIIHHQLHSIEDRRAYNGIAAYSKACRLAYAHAANLVDRLIGQCT